MKMLLILSIRIYQLAISPFFPPSCRFYPSCSQYMIDAVRYHGIIKGIYYGIRRVLKCHPFHAGGFDPVRETGNGE